MIARWVNGRKNKMATKNDITGDSIQSRGVSEDYRNNYDLIFRKKKEVSLDETDEKPTRFNQETQDALKYNK